MLGNRKDTGLARAQSRRQEMKTNVKKLTALIRRDNSSALGTFYPLLAIVPGAGSLQ